MIRFHRTLRFGLVFLLALSLAPLPAAADKKRKKKPPTDAAQSDSPSDVTRAVDSLLLAYDTEGARQALEKIGDGGDPQVTMLRGRLLALEKSFDKAAAELSACADKSPSDPAPLVYLGETHLHAENMAAAEKAFAGAEARARARVESNPADPRALYHLGVAQQRLKKFDAAIETLERARKEDPGNPLIPYQLGMTRAFQENWQTAVDRLTEAIEMDSGIAYAYYYRGLSAGRLGRKDLLINDLDRFLAMAPDAPEAERARRIRDAG